MALFLRRILIISILLTISLQAHAQIGSNEIALRVQKGVEGELKRNETGDKESAYVHKNIIRLTDAIRESKMKGTLDNETADWLVKGIVSYISGMGYGGLSAETDAANKQIPKLIELLKRRFDNLDNNKAHQWMSLSDRLLTNAAEYRIEYRKYIIAKFSTPEILLIRFNSRSRGMYLGNFSLASIASALANESQDSQGNVRSAPSMYNAQDNEIDSGILTLSLARILDNNFKYEKLRDDFSYGCIVSAIFEEDNSTRVEKQLNFQQALPYIDDYLDKVMRKKGNILQISYDGITPVLYALTDIREPLVYEKPVNIPNELANPDGFWVKFSNWKPGWQPLFNYQMEQQGNR